MRQIVTLLFILSAYGGKTQNLRVYWSEDQTAVESRGVKDLFAQSTSRIDTLLYGQVQYQGQYTLFQFFELRDSGVFFYSLPLPNYKSLPFGNHWGQAQLQLNRYGKAQLHLFEADSVFAELAWQAAVDSFEQYRPHLPLNDYKKTTRFRQFLLPKIGDIDLEDCLWVPEAKLQFVDSRREYLGISMGHYLLHTDEQWGHHLSLLAVWEIASRKIVYVVGFNTGYFLE